MQCESLIDQETGFPTERQASWAIFALFAYFAARLVFFAVSIAPSVPPDEVTHFALCRIFSKVFFLPQNSPETYPYGLVTNIPWLYYWLMGKFLHLNFFGMSDLVFLRLLNLPMALGTAWFTLKTARLLTRDRLAHILTVVFITNTLMFSFLSAALSYDNLTNFLATAAIYFMLAFFVKREGNLLLLSLFCQFAGCLTKFSLLPLVLVLDLILVVNEFRNLRLLPSAISSWARSAGISGIVLAIGVLVGFALNLQLYGVNIVKYHDPAPDMAVVLNADSAFKYRTQARNMIFTMYREGRITKEKALQMTSSITNEGDRSCTVSLIEEYDWQVQNGIPEVGPVRYAPIWVATVCNGTFGIFAHQAMAAGELKKFVMFGLLVLAGVGFLKGWRPREDGWLAGYLAVVAVSYGLFLMYFVNYRTYLQFRSLWLSLQGRYIFPVLAPISVLAGIYLLRLVNGKAARLAIFAVAAAIFIFSDFPYFLSQVTPAWFSGPRG